MSRASRLGNPSKDNCVCLKEAGRGERGLMSAPRGHGRGVARPKAKGKGKKGRGMAGGN